MEADLLARHAGARRFTDKTKRSSTTPTLADRRRSRGIEDLLKERCPDGGRRRGGPKGVPESIPSAEWRARRRSAPAAFLATAASHQHTSARLRARRGILARAARNRTRPHAPKETKPSQPPASPAERGCAASSLEERVAQPANSNQEVADNAAACSPERSIRGRECFAWPPR